MCLFQQNFTKKHCEIEGILGVQFWSVKTLIKVFQNWKSKFNSKQFSAYLLWIKLDIFFNYFLVHIIFWSFSKKQFGKFRQNTDWIFGNFISQQILVWEVWSIHQMKDKIKCNLLMKLVLRFTLETLKKLNFKEIVLKFFDWTWIKKFSCSI